MRVVSQITHVLISLSVLVHLKPKRISSLTLTSFVVNNILTMVKIRLEFQASCQVPLLEENRATVSYSHQPQNHDMYTWLLDRFPWIHPGDHQTYKSISQSFSYDSRTEVGQPVVVPVRPIGAHGSQNNMSLSQSKSKQPQTIKRLQVKGKTESTLTWQIYIVLSFTI